MPVSPNAKKLYIVSNNHGPTQKCDFFCFRSEIPFLGKLGPKNQNFQFRLKFAT